MPRILLSIEDALAYLEDHVNLETGSVGIPPGTPAGQLPVPTLDRIRRLLSYLGDPQLDLEILHITGTNGKGSVARMASSLLQASGLLVGTYTSPHLVRVTERLWFSGDRVLAHDRARTRRRTPGQIDDREFVQVLQAVARAEEAAGEQCSFFDLMTGAALRWFGDLAVEAAVLEVGMGGRWDSTNAADGRVAVITNIELDHQEYLGTTREAIANEKSGIVKSGSIAVIGDPDDAIASLLERKALAAGAAEVWRRGRDFACEGNRLAVGGRVVALRTPGARYEDVLVPLYGRHQGENAAVAMAAAEAFAGVALPETVVRDGFAAVIHEGRMEVVRRRPLVVLDGAHNPAGARAAAATLDEEFAAVRDRIVVLGLLRGRDPGVMLDALGAERAKLVIAVEPPSPRALPPAAIAAAAAARGIAVEVVAGIENALDLALDLALAAGEDDGPDTRRSSAGIGPSRGIVFVTGTLYLVGAARAALTASSR